MRPSQDMKRLPHTILILFCTLFIAADEPQKRSLDTHEKVAKAYYAQVQKAGEEKARKRDSRAMPKMATGVVVDRQGKAIPGASVVIGRGVSDAVLGEGTTDATGRFQITLSAQSYKGLSLTVTKDGFNRWAFGGIYGGIVGYRVRLDREIDKGFLKGLIDEKDQDRRLWKLLEIVGDRQFATEIHDLFPHIGTLRDDLQQISERTVRVKARNQIAAEIMKEAGIATDDLYGLVEQHPDWHSGDGVHFNGKGKEAQGAAVAESVLKCLP